MTCINEKHPGHCMLPVLVIARKGTVMRTDECVGCPHFSLAPVQTRPVYAMSTRPRGLGDVVARVLRWVGIGKQRKCGGCKARQEALNRIVPFSKS